MRLEKKCRNEKSKNYLLDRDIWLHKYIIPLMLKLCQTDQPVEPTTLAWLYLFLDPEFGVKMQQMHKTSPPYPDNVEYPRKNTIIKPQYKNNRNFTSWAQQITFFFS